MANEPKPKQSRPRLTERQVLEVLLLQGVIIPCAACGIPLTLEAARLAERDHLRCQHTFPDEDIDQWHALDNQRYIHGRKDPIGCHAAKTSDDRRIRDKVRRIRGETKAGQKAKIPSRPMQKSKAKIPSRPFEKRCRK